MYVCNFNPHSPCGERLFLFLRVFGGILISIHTPLTGSDFLRNETDRLPFEFQSTLPIRGVTCQNEPEKCGCVFQSTLPLRGATIQQPEDRGRRGISIHTLHTGSDFAFSPLPVFRLFQSTLPLRGATVSDCNR